jgi:hypothetical protein
METETRGVDEDETNSGTETVTDADGAPRCR